MKKNICLIITLLLFSSLLFSCRIKNEAETFIKDNNGILNIEKSKALEDFDYMFKVIENNDPDLSVISRKYVVDKDKIYEKYSELLNKGTDDTISVNWMYTCFVSSLMEFKSGHLGLISKESYPDYNLIYDTAIKDPSVINDASVSDKIKYRYDQFNSSKTKEIYSYLGSGSALSSQNNTNTQSSNGENVSILNINKNTLYIKIKSFASQYVESDSEKLKEALNDSNKYNTIILDITGNGGGDSSYWQKNIVGNLIDKSIEVPAYYLSKSGNENLDYFNLMNIQFSYDTSKVTELEKINKSDLKDLNIFGESNIGALPNEDATAFNGKIYLLVDGAVASSSETFAYFCKESKFATLVGTNTGGYGLGFEPNAITLPNSGLIFRYDVVYGLNSDGSSNDEFGTTPDYKSNNNETPQETCFRLINLNEN